jgi:hypothetical protein
MLPIFHFGVLFKENKSKFSTIPTFAPFICLGLAIFPIIANGMIDVRKAILNNYLLLIIN